MSRRSARPKWIKGNNPRTEDETESNKSPMKYKKAHARAPRPAENKGRGHPGDKLK